MGISSHRFLNLMMIAFIAANIFILSLWDYISYNHDAITSITSRKSALFRYAVYFGLVANIILFRATKQTDFVYFQF